MTGYRSLCLLRECLTLPCNGYFVFLMMSFVAEILSEFICSQFAVAKALVINLLCGKVGH